MYAMNSFYDISADILFAAGERNYYYSDDWNFRDTSTKMGADVSEQEKRSIKVVHRIGDAPSRARAPYRIVHNCDTCEWMGGQQL